MFKGHKGNDKHQEQKPTQIKFHKHSKIPLPYTCPHPWTMMIISCNTNITIWTMNSLGWLMYTTSTHPLGRTYSEKEKKRWEQRPSTVVCKMMMCCTPTTRVRYKRIQTRTVLRISTMRNTQGTYARTYRQTWHHLHSLPPAVPA